MIRSTILFLVGVVGAVAAGNPRRVPDFGVVLNDDADLSFMLPDRGRSEALLRANIGALADTPVKTLTYCIGMGGDVLYYQTRVASPVGWRKAADEKPGSLMEKRMENARACLAQGADAVRTAGETAKRLGLWFIPSLRMNDAHFIGDPDGHSMTSEFWLRHRDCTIKKSPLGFNPAYGNLLDYAQPAVRQLRLDTVYEALERNRDLVDGFELDFNRFQVFFAQGKAAAGAPLMTELVRQVRARLDQMARELKRPLYLFVRVPPSLADCTTAGLEVERWMGEGLVDVVSPAQIMTLAWDMPIADLVDLGRKYGVQIYPSLYPRTSWRIPFEPLPKAAKPILTREATPEEIRGAAANYRRLGVAGFYLFNFYSAFGTTRPHPDAFYGLLRDLAREENLLGEPKVYAVTKSYYHDGAGSYAYGKQLPARLAAGAPCRLTLPIAERPGGVPFPLKTCALRIGFRNVTREARVTVSVNGHRLFEGALGGTASKPGTARPLPKQPDAAQEYLQVAISKPEMLKDGSNLVSVVVDRALATAEITDLEVRYEYYSDYAKLWLREPAPLNPASATGGR